MGDTDSAAVELKRAVKLLKEADEYGLDLETTGFNPRQDAIKGISLSVGLSDDKTWWFPFRGTGALSQVKTLRELAPVFSDPSKTWVGSNVKFDLKFLLMNGVSNVRNSFADTVVAQWLIDEESRRGLKQLAKKYLGVEMVGYKEAAAMEGGLFPHIFADYAKDDARYVLELWKRLKIELHDQKLTKLFHDVEMQITMALTEMELTGIAIDKKYLLEFEQKMITQRDEAREKAFEIAGKKFKIDSPKEVAALLFDDMRLKPLPGMQKGKSGYYSVNEDTLTRYSEPIIAELLRHRTAAHNLKTYCTPYKERLKTIDRIYAEFNQAGTVAGRFTCLPAWTRIATSTGIIPISEARVGMLVQTPEGPAPITQHVLTGHKNVIRLALESGRFLVCTPEHRVFCNGQWIHAGQVRPGDSLYACGVTAPEPETLVALPRHPNKGRKKIQFPTHLDESTAFLLGHYVAEGCIGFNKQRPSKLKKSPPVGTKIPAKAIIAFGWDENDLFDLIESEWGRIFGISGKRVVGTCPQLVLNSIDVATWLVDVGCGGTSQSKRVPEAVFRSPQAVIRAFLRGLFEGDGGSTEGYPYFTTESEGLSQDVATLLSAIGIHFSVCTTVRERGSTRHRIIVLSQSWERFADLGLFWSERKLQAIRTASRSGRHIGVEQPSWLDLSEVRGRVKEAYGWTGPCNEATRIYRLHKKRSRLTPAAIEFLSPGLDLAEESDQFIDWARRVDALSLRVLYVEDAGEEETYDIEVADTECFLADGVLVHNSNNPNLQQISKDIKPIFVAASGMKLVCGDFNQLQFRLVGHFAKRVLGKSKVADAYLEGMDLHTKTQEELKFTDRRDAKIVNFAFLFGRGWKAFMEAQRTDERTAKAYYNGFHKAYPEVRRMAEWCRRKICKEGFVSSIAGRRRHFANMLGTDPQAKDAYWPGWVAWNAVIQGAESDLVRVTMRNVQRTIEANREKDKRWWGVHLQVQVHDEIMAEAPEEIAEEVSEVLTREAENAMTLEVPIIFECGQGDSWDQAKP